MATYVTEVRRMEWCFDGMEVRHVPRKDNVDADELSRLGLSRAHLPPRVFEEWLT